jgi:translocation and assembly module TamB
LEIDGSATLQTLTEGSVQLDAQRLDSPGHYAVNGRITPDAIQATITAREPAKGLLASLAQLPDLGAVSIQASVNGPKDALGTQVGLTAGPMTASASGTVDLTHQAADLAVKAQAPAMTPAAGISWQSVLVDATVHGPFTRPDAKGTVQIASLSAGGARIGALAADVTGNAGQVQLHATVRDLQLPGPRPDIFAANPVTLDVSARLDAPDRPVTFAIHHALLSLDGTAKTKGVQQVQAHLVVPDLSPFATAGGADIHGSTDLAIQAEMKDGTTTASAKGRIAVTGGMARVPALIGDDGSIDVAVSLHGQDITLSRLSLNGKSLAVTAQASLSDQTINADWTLALADLTAIQPNLAGRLDVKGHAGGKLNDIAVQAEVGADLAAKGYKSGHITAKVDATGLPRTPHGQRRRHPAECAVIARTHGG